MEKSEPYNLGELTKLRNSASAFYHKMKQVFKSDVEELLDIKDYETAKSSFSQVVLRNDFRLDGDRVLVCTKAGVIAYYSLSDADIMSLYKAEVSKFNMIFTMLDNEPVRVMRGKNNKYTEVLSEVSGFGYIYFQPMTIMPNVFLNSSGGFRDY
jgi:hypothetical protein